MYPLKLHAGLNPDRWYNYSRGRQLLMIANEFNRARNWIEKDQFFEVNMCYERAFELIDLTVEDEKWRGRLKELLRLREVMAEMYLAETKDVYMNQALYDAVISMSWESYNLFY
jgi:hypothetical protein